MNQQSITIEFKDQFGRVTARPYCETAERFARIAGTKTLTIETLRQVAGLGYEIRAIAWEGSDPQPLPYHTLQAKLSA